MGRDNNKNIIDSFSGVNEQMQRFSKLTSQLDFIPILNAQSEIQSIGLTASKMIEGMKYPLLETYSYLNSSGLLEAVSQLSKIKLPINDFQKRLRVFVIKDYNHKVKKMVNNPYSNVRASIEDNGFASGLLYLVQFGYSEKNIYHAWFDKTLQLKELIHLLV